MEIYDLGYWNGFRRNHYEYGNLYIKNDKISSLKEKYKMQGYLQDERVCNRLDRLNYETSKKYLGAYFDHLIYIKRDSTILKKYKYGVGVFKNTLRVCATLRLIIPLSHSLDLG